MFNIISLQTTNMDKREKSLTVPRAGSDAKQLEFAYLAKRNAKRHSTLEYSEAFSCQVNYTFNHITKQVYNISLQKRFVLQCPKQLYYNSQNWMLPK